MTMRSALWLVGIAAWGGIASVRADDPGQSAPGDAAYGPAFPGEVDPYATAPSVRRGISAFEALQVVIENYGEGYGARLARIEGFGGQDQPREWAIYAYDYKFPRRIDRFVVRDGQVVKADLLSAADSVKFSTRPFSATTDLLDSGEIFAFAEAAARRAKTGFDSADYVLFWDEDSEVPVYRIGLRNERSQFVGGIKLAASSRLSGEEYWSDWPGSVDPGEIAESEARRAKEDVKEFFKDFGRSVRDVFRDE